MESQTVSTATESSDAAEHTVGSTDPQRETADARRRYDRASHYYDFQVWPMELMGMRRFRRQVLDRVSGPRVLEVGVGTGINLPDYAADLDIDAIDLSPRMLERARRRRGIRARMHLHEADVQTLASRTLRSIPLLPRVCSVPSLTRFWV